MTMRKRKSRRQRRATQGMMPKVPTKPKGLFARISAALSRLLHRSERPREYVGEFRLPLSCILKLERRYGYTPAESTEPRTALLSLSRFLNLAGCYLEGREVRQTLLRLFDTSSSSSAVPLRVVASDCQGGRDPLCVMIVVYPNSFIQYNKFFAPRSETNELTRMQLHIYDREFAREKHAPRDRIVYVSRGLRKALKARIAELEITK